MSKPKQRKRVIKNKCLVETCSREYISRGLCRKCYMGACDLVKKGVTTWKELADNKLAIFIPKKEVSELVKRFRLIKNTDLMVTPRKK